MEAKLTRSYLYIILLLMLVLPAISMFVDMYSYQQHDILNLIGKWFTFWAVGIRLFTAGIRQIAKPAFTAQDIFHISNAESFVIVKELGFANLCMGSIGIISVFMPGWRMAAAFVGGLYMGIAGIQHIIKKPAGPNEVVAMISDIFIFLLMAIYLVGYYM